jgi:hypothetical protein
MVSEMVESNDNKFKFENVKHFILVIIFTFSLNLIMLIYYTT